MNIALPENFEITKVGIENLSSLPDDVIVNGLGTLGEFSSVADWLAGDLICELKRRRKDTAGSTTELSNQLEFNFVNHVTATDVAGKIPFSHREMSLSFPHHREIALECDSLEEIDIWLNKAAQNEWSLTKLRKELRNRQVDESKTGKVSSPLEWLESFATSASKICQREISTLQQSEKEALKQTLEPLVEMYKALKASDQGASGEAPPVQESYQNG